MSMRILKTDLTEEEFWERLARLCHPKEKHARGYGGRDTFVYDRRGDWFWLGSFHGPDSKTPGLAADRISGLCRVESDGTVTVAYRHDLHPGVMIPSLVALATGLALAVLTAVQLAQGDGGGHAWAVLFLTAFGGVGLFGSPKERRAQEAHLRYICAIGEDAREASRNGCEQAAGKISMPEGGSEVCPVYLVYGGRTYVTLDYYPEDGGEGEILHADGHPLFFRDEPQLYRFCEAKGLTTAGGGTTIRFDEPITEGTPPSRLLARWHRLASLAEVQGLRFEGDEEAHAALYESLLTQPMAAKPDRPWSTEQVAELNRIFAHQADIFAGFCMWRE